MNSYIKMNVLLLATLLASSILPSPAKPGARIIGGSDAVDAEFPFAASIQTTTPNGRFFCGGALLNSQWILTAASCIKEATSFSIRLGTNKLHGNDANLIQTTAYNYRLHPDYDVKSLDNDIALIQLQMAVEFSDYVQPIHLPTRALQEFSVVTAIGWGQISDEDDGLQNHLQTVILDVLSNAACRLYYGNQVTDNMVCANGKSNQGTCFGDNGGPLIQYVNVDTATAVGVSIFSSGNGCESTDPSGFTRVFSHLDWIRASIEDA